MNRKRVAILISGRGSNMAALIEAARGSDYPAEIVLVIADCADAGGLARARAADIATRVVEHRSFAQDREAFEGALQQARAEQRVEIVCLAGFMRVLTPAVLARLSGRLLHIRPALLPCFKGTHTDARARGRGVQVPGASVPLVVAEVDSGP